MLSQRRQTAGVQTGSSTIETLLAVPFLMTVVFLIVEFGMLFKDYLLLTDGVSTAGRTLAVSRGQADNPCVAAKNRFFASAADIDPDQLSMIINIDGTNYPSDAEGGFCSGVTLESGLDARLSVSYPCSVRMFGVELASDCTLSSSSAVRIE